MVSPLPVHEHALLFPKVNPFLFYTDHSFAFHVSFCHLYESLLSLNQVLFESVYFKHYIEVIV